jgi:hypothetical protein
VDDPEPNDSPTLSTRAMPQALCPMSPYLGRLFRVDGRSDRQDWFHVWARRAGDLQFELRVPPDPSVNYGMAVYRDPQDGALDYSDVPPGEDESVDLRDMPSGQYWIQIYTQDRSPDGGPAQIEAPYRLEWRQP